ncbi:efflux RND transporter periplasmic adaptor subunit [Desulfitibacter alkalitolerans]|uniref:efflux RND transporter periplasmic adaptor subunit n=1 Tax=Desulfitibacter alkalitolerans TaxID=264641 RepID=UPI000A0164DC|nr:efflux RND transporter periplasmic adaptor subunit [Desulfitibacter alkalitolerans]
MMLNIRPNVFNKKIISLVLLALAAFISITGYAISTKPTAKPVETPVPVKTDEVKVMDFSGQLSLTGIMDAQEKSNLSSQLPGIVTNVGAKEGAFVKKGAVIISLDKKDLLNQLDQAKAGLANSQAQAEQARLNYENAENDYQRFQELFKFGAISQQQMEQITLKRDIAKSQYETAQGAGIQAAQAAINAINLNLAKMDIKSPINGILVTSYVSVGDTVGPGIPLSTIVAIDQLALTGNLAESQINYVKAGDPVEVSADSIPNRTFTGQISYISPVSIPTGQFFPVEITVNNPEGILKAGMTATAKITVRNPSVMVIPNSALLKQDDKNFVMVVKDGKAVKTAVRKGLENEESTVITQGLQAGQRIVINGTERLADGVEVKE